MWVIREGDDWYHVSFMQKGNSQELPKLIRILDDAVPDDLRGRLP